MPPRAPPQTAGGMRVKAGRRLGPSAALSKKYKADDKARMKREDKAAKGGLRNDNTLETTKQLCWSLLPVAGVVGLMAAMIIAAGDRISPGNAANTIAVAGLDFLETWGAEVGLVSVAAALLFSGFLAWRRSATAAAEAAALLAAAADAKATKAARKEGKKSNATAKAEALSKRRAAQRSLIEAEEAELARLREGRAVAAAEREAAKVAAEIDAAGWSEHEQALLDRALSEFPVTSWEGADGRWQKVASKVVGRTAEQCLCRMAWCRQQAIFANAKGDPADASFDDAFGGDDLSGGAAPSGGDYRRWYQQTYEVMSLEDDNSDISIDSGADDEVGDSDGGSRELLEVELDPDRRGVEVLLPSSLVPPFFIFRSRAIFICAFPTPRVRNSE